MDEKFRIDADDKNNTEIGESNDDLKTCADIEKGEEKGDEVLFEEVENHGEEVKNAAEEAEAATKEAESIEEKTENAPEAVEPPTFSAVYRASENGYSCTSGTQTNQKKKSSKKLVISIVAVSLAVVLLLGASLGSSLYFAIKYFEAIDSQPIVEDQHGSYETPTKDEENIIIVDDGDININEENYTEDGEALSVVEVVENVAASVVEVSTLTTSNYGQYVSSGAGSGVIIAKGDNYSYIVTNYHVVGGSDSIIVRLNDKREYEATYIDGDEKSDIAVIKIQVTENITMAKRGSSSKLKVGEEVVAIGNPLGELGGTVTNGIISALDREITIDGTTMVLLQTNAAVNPGNSGGGLFNMSGELIAIVNAKQSATGIEGLGFAIPIDYVYDDVFEIINDGYIHGRVSFGIEVTYLDAYSAYYYFRSRSAGIYVTSSSNPEFKQGDRITEVNSQSLDELSDLTSIIDKVEIGDKVTFRIVRNNVSSDIVIIAEEYIPSNNK